MTTSKNSMEYEPVISPTYSNLTLATYSELIKSKQTFLLVYTTIFAYLISAWNNGIVLSDFLWITVGLFFAVSGSTLLNMYIDRDIDAIMERTKERALPSGKIPASTVLKHGILFTTAGILAVGVFINILTMIIVFLGFFFDVVIYSIIMKRRTKYSIIFGGVAGGLPALAGRTAALGRIDTIGILLSLFVVAWIPLHFLTLALVPKNLEGYKKANIPVWPIVSGITKTIRVITLSAMISASLILITAIFLGIHLFLLLPMAIFCYFILYQAFKNLKTPTNELTYKIFKLASIFMAIGFLLLFIGVIITSFL